MDVLTRVVPKRTRVTTLQPWKSPTPPKSDANAATRRWSIKTAPALPRAVTVKSSVQQEPPRLCSDGGRPDGQAPEKAGPPRRPVNRSGAGKDRQWPAGAGGPQMSIEMKCLALAVVLGLVQILLSAHSASLQVGYWWTAVAREARTPLTGIAGRLERALRNFLETFPMFVAAILLVQLTGRTGRMSALGAEMYLVARVVYVPLYVVAIPVVRSLVWNVATVGIALVLLSLVRAW